MKKDQQVVRNMKHKFLHAGITMALAAGMMATLPSAYAGGKITIDDTKWISIGMGMRGGFQAASGRAGNGGYGNEFGINNARIYLNGQIHENIKFEFNTESFNVGHSVTSGSGGAGAGFASTSGIGILDAIAKFEFNRYVNLWAGRMLVPTERGELNGPFYHATFEGFKTPFFPQDYSANVIKSGGTGGVGSGMYGRDNGVTFFGDMDTKNLVGLGHLQYSMGVFTGTRGVQGPNQSDSASYAGRLTYNFLNPEKNPGYYTSGTYYGTAGDILAVAVGVNHQKNGAGSLNYRTDFTGVVADVLFEKVLDNNMGVFTFNGEYKRFWANGGTAHTLAQRIAMFAAEQTGLGGFGQFSGQSWTAYGLYLIPHKVGIGRFQPYGRYTSIQPDMSAMRTEAEGGMNYVIDGHNARLAAFYQRGNLYTTGLNYAPGATGQTINAFKVAFQLQI